MWQEIGRTMHHNFLRERKKKDLENFWIKEEVWDIKGLSLNDEEKPDALLNK